jgi:hypothetical protein
MQRKITQRAADMHGVLGHISASTVVALCTETNARPRCVAFVPRRGLVSSATMNFVVSWLAVR